jgi:hypothetical protein
MGKVCVDFARNDNRELCDAHENVTFELGNGWDVTRLLQIGQHFNVIFVDVGGISGVDGE